MSSRTAQPIRDPMKHTPKSPWRRVGSRLCALTRSGRDDSEGGEFPLSRPKRSAGTWVLGRLTLSPSVMAGFIRATHSGGVAPGSSITDWVPRTSRGGIDISEFKYLGRFRK